MGRFGIWIWMGCTGCFSLVRLIAFVLIAGVLVFGW